MSDYQNRYRVSEVVSTKEWITTSLILMIPFVNLIMVFVWAFGGGANPSKANFFKAQIIIWVGFAILWMAFIGTLFNAVMN